MQLARAVTLRGRACDARSVDVQFLGAARTVTGSMHLVRTQSAKVLLDCGLYQGRRKEAATRNRELPFDPRELDAVVLSHAHIDHSGLLPVLRKHGFDGKVYMTPATRDLCAVMLEDAAHIQAYDARYINKLIERGDLEGPAVVPLYDKEDVLALLGCTETAPYHQRIEVTSGVHVTFLDAGHVLGSAIVALDLEDAGRSRRLVFSGDLGRRGMPILRDPEMPEGAHALICESTYGDRLHPPRAAMDDELAEVITRTAARGGKVFIPTFALERAQEIILSLKRLQLARRLPPIPVFLDSPLAVKVTDVFRMHPDCYDAEARRLLSEADSPFDVEGLEYVTAVERSKEVTKRAGACIILAGSGMCESGRIVHHLRQGVENERNTVIIVGFQASHTLGRRLVERRTRIRIFGVERDRYCEVKVLNGFSAHADQDDLVEFARETKKRGALGPVALVHGEIGPQEALRARLQNELELQVQIPELGDVMDL